MDLLINFWKGRIKLWKSYWIVGELLNFVFIFIIINLEVKYFNNLIIFQKLPFLDFNDFSFLNKILIISWSTFVTVGIWRSAEAYEGKFIWTVLTLIFLSYRVFSLRILFY
tara:strand:- start:35 stop:367 length:333 start_codon:yes stop_codon:yes gene_type:complete